jgi:GTP-binding protein
VLTSAKPKIADYPFTTLKHNLGIVAYRDFQSFVIADIPGIIEGAAEGKGLGHYFLRHIERNSTLLFLIPVDTPNIKEEYDILVNELTKYNPEMLDKERIVVTSKCDMLDDELKAELKTELDKEFAGTPYLFISSVAQQGLTELKDKLWNMLNMEDEYPGIAIQGVSGFDKNEQVVKINNWTSDEKIAFWKEVMKYGRDRGFDIYFFTWKL